MKSLLLLLAAALATLALSVAWAEPPSATLVGERGSLETVGQPGAAGRAAAGGVAPGVSLRHRAARRAHCPRPATLYLRRFEDRSARLECAGRVLVRVSVPG